MTFCIPSTVSRSSHLSYVRGPTQQRLVPFEVFATTMTVDSCICILFSRQHALVLVSNQHVHAGLLGSSTLHPSQLTQLTKETQLA